jgi:nucleoside-diphosphate-sugar epimerase
MSPPVLVTGGTGRLGRSVVARLVDAGQEVRVLARHQRDTQPQVTFFTGPAVSSWEDLFRSYLTATHQRRWVVPVPAAPDDPARTLMT